MSIRTSATVQEFFCQSNFPLKDTLCEKSVDFLKTCAGILILVWKSLIGPIQIFLTSRCLKLVTEYLLMCGYVIEFWNLFGIISFRVELKLLEMIWHQGKSLIQQTSFLLIYSSKYYFGKLLSPHYVSIGKIAPLFREYCLFYKNIWKISQSNIYLITPMFGHSMTNLFFFLPMLENMIQSLCNVAKCFLFREKSDCKESLEFLLDRKVIVSLPKSLPGGLEDDILDFFHVVLFKSVPTMVLKNVISSALYEAFCDIFESMYYIDLTAFSASDARQVIFLLQFFCHQQ